MPPWISPLQDGWWFSLEDFCPPWHVGQQGQGWRSTVKTQGHPWLEPAASRGGNCGLGEALQHPPGQQAERTVTQRRESAQRRQPVRAEHAGSAGQGALQDAPPGPACQLRLAGTGYPPDRSAPGTQTLPKSRRRGANEESESSSHLTQAGLAGPDFCSGTPVAPRRPHPPGSMQPAAPVHLGCRPDSSPLAPEPNSWTRRTERR